VSIYAHLDAIALTQKKLFLKSGIGTKSATFDGNFRSKNPKKAERKSTANGKIINVGSLLAQLVKIKDHRKARGKYLSKLLGLERKEMPHHSACRRILSEEMDLD